MPGFVLLGGVALVLAVHPERFSGWALWALGPLILAFAYLLAFRGPPLRMRAVGTAALAGAYAVAYGLAAGLGDEAYTDVATIVYLYLPSLGLVAVLALFLVVELAGALQTLRGRQEPLPRAMAMPARRSLAIGGALTICWAALALTVWGSPKIVVEGERGRVAESARVRCEGEDTYLSTPTVRRRGDGIYVQVQNASDEAIWLEYEVDDGWSGGGAEHVAPGSADIVVRLLGRTLGVVCSRRGNGDATNYATLRVVGSEPAGSRGSPDTSRGLTPRHILLGTVHVMTLTRPLGEGHTMPGLATSGDQNGHAQGSDPRACPQGLTVGNTCSLC